MNNQEQKWTVTHYDDFGEPLRRIPVIPDPPTFAELTDELGEAPF